MQYPGLTNKILAARSGTFAPDESRSEAAKRKSSRPTPPRTAGLTQSALFLNLAVDHLLRGPDGTARRVLEVRRKGGRLKSARLSTDGWLSATPGAHDLQVEIFETAVVELSAAASQTTLATARA